MLRRIIKCGGVFYRAASTVSEARLSIRESIATFCRVEAYMDSDSSLTSLESLCRQTKVSSVLYETDELSCGSTMKHFASLFLSKKQINPNFLEYCVNGSMMTQFANNPNILMSTLRYSLFDKEEKSPRFDYYSKKISHISSLSGYSKINEIMLANDEDAKLPRILFCSIAWVGGGGSTHCEDNIKDHKFTLIKFSNTRFQMLQGYISFSKSENSHSDSTASFDGFNLRSWQATGHKYARGFGREPLTVFLKGLETFATGHNFDKENYYDLFNVHHSNSNDDGEFWPSVSHIELTDEFIIGCGERDMSEAIDLIIRRK